MPTCFKLLRHWIRLARSLALARAGNSIAARMAMMAITTKSSISVKPRRPDEGILPAKRAASKRTPRPVPRPFRRGEGHQCEQWSLQGALRPKWVFIGLEGSIGRERIHQIRGILLGHRLNMAVRKSGVAFLVVSQGKIVMDCGLRGV